MAISFERYLAIVTYQELLSYYGTQVAIADALGITQPTVSSWRGVVPPRYQYQVEVLTSGALRVSDELRGAPARSAA